MHLNMSRARPISFIVTRDRAKAKSFYGGLLGFRLTGEDDFAAVFDMNGAMLRISTNSASGRHPEAAIGSLGSWTQTAII
jgi:catechol 2,3-dioxygenase-like lactoylglutathione lyase family enzyme